LSGSDTKNAKDAKDATVRNMYFVFLHGSHDQNVILNRFVGGTDITL
jgi:hypothetical protein